METSSLDGVERWKQDRRQRKEFLRSLRPGDLIKWNGSFRLVREVIDKQKRGNKGFSSRMFVFAKLRCSRYPNTYTCYGWSSLFHGTVELIARNVKFKTWVSEMVDKDIKRRVCEERFIEQCDTVGMTA
jgi:hypothetical protein